MKMLTASLLVCAMMALTGADDVPTGEPDVTSGTKGNASLVMLTTSCLPGWTSYNGRCFLYIPSTMTWADAEKHCLNVGGNLASVHSFEEKQMIQDMIHVQTSAYPLSWLGGYDATQEGSWFWSDGSRFDYTYWAPGKPDNQNNANCLLMNFGDEKKFADEPCSTVKPFVCAKKL